MMFDAASVGSCAPGCRRFLRYGDFPKALPLPCVSTVFLSKTVPFHVVLHNTRLQAVLALRRLPAAAAPGAPGPLPRQHDTQQQ
eukprot:SAG22_NODE_436_length_10519_cov_21.912188_5_plen_84_part_00